MKIEIVHEGKVLPHALHEGELYFQAPSSGNYILRLKNDRPFRRLAVVSVDGVNVLSGEDADHDGAGYVLSPYETLEIPGWRREGGKAAAFEFRAEEGSYAAQTGRGTANVGIVGVAVFEEKVETKVVPPIVIEKHVHHHEWPWRRPYYPWNDIYRPIWVAGTGGILEDACGGFGTGEGGLGGTYCSTNSAAPEATLSFQGASAAKSVLDVGTAYGREVDFKTVDAKFRRASSSPSLVLTARYATKERLKEWGIVIAEASARRAPSAFPAARGSSCPAPKGWRP